MVMQGKSRSNDTQLVFDPLITETKGGHSVLTFSQNTLTGIEKSSPKIRALKPWAVQGTQNK